MLASSPRTITKLQGPNANADFFINNLAVRVGCIFKAGAEGSFLCLRNENNNDCNIQVTQIPAKKITHVLDTTGCGDNYCSGFEIGLTMGWDIVDCCRLGTATAARCAMGLGSDYSNESLDSTISFMNQEQ